MQKLIDIAMGETAIVMPEKELREIVADAERYETLFYDLLRACLTGLGQTPNPAIEKWIGEHYLELRAEMGGELKQLYLKNIAFRTNTRVT